MIAGANEAQPTPRPPARSKLASAPAPPSSQATSSSGSAESQDSGSSTGAASEPPADEAAAPSDETEGAETPTDVVPTPEQSPPPGQPGSGEGGSESGSESGGSTTTPKPVNPEPTPPPAPTFTAGVGWSSTGAVPMSSVTSNRATVDCKSSRLTQDLRASVSHDGRSYPGVLRLEAIGGGARLELTVTAGGEDYVYTSWGANPSASWSRDGSDAGLHVTGSYGPRYGQRPESAGLPHSGTFSASLTLDCSYKMIATETVALSP